MGMPNQFKINQFEYKSYTLLSEGELREIWEQRNHPDIRKYMENDQVFSFESHMQFVKRLQTCQDRIYYGVYYEGELIASQCFTDIDYIQKKAEHGIYVFAHLIGRGYGSYLKSAIYDYAFRNGYFDYILERVKHCNQRNLGLNEKLGFMITNEDAVYVYMSLSKSSFAATRRKED